MKINFKNLRIETSVDVFECLDIAKDVGNFLFVNATDLEMDDLARTIYHSDGEIAISKDIYEQMLTILQSGISFRVIQGIKQQVEKEQNDTK